MLNSYLNQYYQDAAVETQHFKLSSLPYYYIPEQGSLQSFKDYIQTLPQASEQRAGSHSGPLQSGVQLASREPLFGLCMSDCAISDAFL